jgi:peptidoglycan hydrolase-like protein with peptidoglycan-binding domain
MTLTKKIICALVVYSVGLFAGTYADSASILNTVGSSSSSSTNVFTLTATSTPITISTNTASITAQIPLLVKYNKYGNKGDEVQRLQSFLNSYEGEKIPTTGYYHNLTKAAVKRFQTKYGIKPTGVQHVKTTAKINEIFTSNPSKFVLTKKVIYIPKVSSVKISSVKTAKANVDQVKLQASKSTSSDLDLTNPLVSTASSGMNSLKINISSTASYIASSTKDIAKGLTSIKVTDNIKDMKPEGASKNIFWLLIFIPLILLLLFPRAIYDIFTSKKSDKTDSNK